MLSVRAYYLPPKLRREIHLLHTLYLLKHFLSQQPKKAADNHFAHEETKVRELVKVIPTASKWHSQCSNMSNLTTVD